jgi:sRNA-binding carbon storage regulator CsrA
VLIVSLRVNESINLPGGIEIMISSIGVAGMKLRGGHVKLGVRAPEHVRIRRGRRLAPKSYRNRRRSA